MFNPGFAPYDTEAKRTIQISRKIAHRSMVNAREHLAEFREHLKQQPTSAMIQQEVADAKADLEFWESVCK